MKVNKKWYFIVLYNNGLKNSEWDMTKAEAKALYDYHMKNMSVLEVKTVSWGSLDD